MTPAQGDQGPRHRDTEPAARHPRPRLRRGKPPGTGAHANRQEHCDVLAHPSFALPRPYRLLYRRRPRQFCKTGKVPAYETLPAVPHRMGKSRYLWLSYSISYERDITGHIGHNDPRRARHGTPALAGAAVACRASRVIARPRAAPVKPRRSVKARRSCPEFRGYQLCDLRGVQCRTLAQVVAAHEQLDGPRVIQRLADPADPGRVGADHIDRGRELASLGIIGDHDAGRGPSTSHASSG